ncbi:MAG: hypothetical protein C4554_09165 [Dethiobacter sp.]|nr:MAG: hypothetical protein C4554_09165 [Dethiobacter sp.]
MGSLYTFGLKGIFDYEYDEKGQLHMLPAKTPQQKGIEIKDLDQALNIYAEWNLRRPLYSAFYDPQDLKWS